MNKVKKNKDLPGFQLERKLDIKIADPSAIPDGENLSLKLALSFRILLNLENNSVLYEELGLKFRPNQLMAIKCLKEKLADPKWNLKGYFVQPTGAGKTVLFGAIARMADLPTTIFVPKTNLLEQTIKELMYMCGFTREDIGIVGDGHKEFGRKITIATYQSHVSLIKSSSDYQADFEGKSIIICDEAHKGVGKQTLAALDLNDVDNELTLTEKKSEQEALKNLSEVSINKVIFGFTATPKLGEKHIQNAFGGTEIARETFADLVMAEVLVPLNIHHTEGNIYRDTDMAGEKITMDQESKILERENTYDKLLRQYVEVQSQQSKKMKTIAYCATLKECDRFIEHAEKKFGLICKRVTASDPKNSLMEAEEGLKNGTLNIVVTVDKLTEGWNFPPADAAIIARACGSPARLLQSIGRVVRSSLGKSNAHIFETDWKVIIKKRNDSSQPSATTEKQEDKKDPDVGSRTGKRFNVIEAFLANGETLDGIAHICQTLNDAPFKYIGAAKAPEGWLTTHGLAVLLNVTTATIERIVTNIVGQDEQAKGYLQNYLDSVGKQALHCSPELVKLIIESYNSRGESAPEGWLTNRALAAELEVDFGTVQKVAGEYAISNPDWFVNYLNKINRPNIHYSPELVQIIRKKLSTKEAAPVGWISRRDLRTVLGCSDRTILAAAIEVAVNFPDGQKECTDGKNKILSTYYSPEFVEKIKQKLNSRGQNNPPGWMHNFDLSKQLKIKRDTLKKIADQYIAGDSNLAKEYLNDRNQKTLYYSPALISMLTNEVASRKK